MADNIYVTKSFLPPIKEYEEYLKQIFDNCILTNQGKLLMQLEKKITSFLNVKNFQYVTNGTLALQLALDSLNIKNGEIITTPFTYVATTTSILWERCEPVFVDIEPDNFTLDPAKIEKAITPRTKAILPVHVFGYACDVEAIQKIADKHELKVIYDGAHAFAARYKGRSLLDFGDITTCSFHATKLFHTVEGGGCVVKNDIVNYRLNLAKCFGHDNDAYFQVGINAKQSEFHAAMGLANFGHLGEILEKRRIISETYDSLLNDVVGRPKKQNDLEYNYAYYPVVFKNEEELLSVFEALNAEGIFPRRYFYPSLNKLSYVKGDFSCPISEDIASRIACLPLYPDLALHDVERICLIIRNVIGKRAFNYGVSLKSV